MPRLSKNCFVVDVPRAESFGFGATSVCLHHWLPWCPSCSVCNCCCLFCYGDQMSSEPSPGNNKLTTVQHGDSTWTVEVERARACSQQLLLLALVVGIIDPRFVCCTHFSSPKRLIGSILATLRGHVPTSAAVCDVGKLSVYPVIRGGKFPVTDNHRLGS